MYYQQEKQIKAMIHGDDFVMGCDEGDAKWMVEKLEEYITAEHTVEVYP